MLLTAIYSACAMIRIDCQESLLVNKALNLLYKLVFAFFKITKLDLDLNSSELRRKWIKCQDQFGPYKVEQKWTKLSWLMEFLLDINFKWKNKSWLSWRLYLNTFMIHIPVMPPPVYMDAFHLKYHLYTEQGERNYYGKCFTQLSSSTHMYSYSVSWRIDWLTDWLIDWLTDWLHVKEFMTERLDNWMTRRPEDRKTGWPNDWMTRQPDDWTTRQPDSRTAGWPANWTTRPLDDSTTGWLNHQTTGWLNNWIKRQPEGPLLYCTSAVYMIN